MARKYGDEITLRSLLDHGRTELASALLRHNDGHVMYMKGMEPEGQSQQPATMKDLKAQAAKLSQEQDQGRDGPDQDRGR